MSDDTRQHPTGTRRWAALFAAAFLLLAGLVGGTGTAAATTGSSAGVLVTNCNHSGGTGTLQSANYVRIQGDGAAVGAVQLCSSGSSYWGYIVFYAAVQPGNWGQVRLDRIRGGSVIGSWNCDSSGGNGYVQPGQTQCWTPSINRGTTTDVFQAVGVSCFGNTHPYCTSTDAWGRTLATS
ncbi:hypothetical protein [Amycolatopsis sp. NPDC051102]|uniref:hypothetical protein n=1 Tax=Amycolatopsis sp. NPDC051102 TaxID=3155163 RepID=UPI00344220C0